MKSNKIAQKVKKGDFIDSPNGTFKEVAKVGRPDDAYGSMKIEFVDGSAVHIYRKTKVLVKL